MVQQTIGEVFRHARESMGSTLYEASRHTRIRIDFLEAMERDNFRFVSGQTYVRGLIRTYSKWLGIDSEPLVDVYDNMHGPTKGPSVRQIFKPSTRGPKVPKPNWPIAAAVAAVLLLMFSLIGIVSPAGPEVAAPPAPSDATTTAPSTIEEPTQIAAIPSTDGVELSVVATTQSCWLRVVVDEAQSSPLFQGTLRPGDRRTFRAPDKLVVTFGNLGMVRIEVNGRDLGVPGLPGEVGTFTFTPATTGFTRG